MKERRCISRIPFFNFHEYRETTSWVSFIAINFVLFFFRINFSSFKFFNVIAHSYEYYLLEWIRLVVCLCYRLCDSRNLFFCCVSVAYFVTEKKNISAVTKSIAETCNLSRFNQQAINRTMDALNENMEYGWYLCSTSTVSSTVRHGMALG